MQCLANQPLRIEAFEAVFGHGVKSVEDDKSTSAGSSDRGSSPGQGTASDSSPCSIRREPIFDIVNPAPRKVVRSKKPVRKAKISINDTPVGPPPGLPMPVIFAAPPGLVHPSIGPPPGLEDVWAALETLKSPSLMSAPPGLEKVEYTPKSFRKELTSILRELASTRNVAAAVRRVRAQNVPQNRHAAEFTDILTRAAEEHRGIARRLYFAFAVGLTAGTDSAFDRAECIKGLSNFFSDVYGDLCEEVPRLPIMARTELVPTLRSVLPEELVNPVLPVALQAQ